MKQKKNPLEKKMKVYGMSLIDNLDKVGGQCSELYPEKPIFDIPSRTSITGQELTDNLMAQAKPFEPIFHLGQQAEKIEKIENDNWKITTSLNNIVIARCIVIAGGAGSFVPRRPTIDNIEKYENYKSFCRKFRKDQFIITTVSEF